MVTVRIENWYEDGHESKREVLLAPPTGSVEEWFDEIVYQETGDGHGADNKLGSCYVATVIACDDAALLGESREWVD